MHCGRNMAEIFFKKSSAILLLTGWKLNECAWKEAYTYISLSNVLLSQDEEESSLGEYAHANVLLMCC